MFMCMYLHKIVGVEFRGEPFTNSPTEKFDRIDQNVSSEKLI